MPHYSERRTSRLELFFDLVSVAAVAQFIHQLTNGPTRTGMFALAGAYLAVWSIWFSVVLLVNVFGEWTRGIGAMVAGMLGIGVMAASVPRAEHGSGFSFGMAFALTALFVSVCWVRCLRQDPDAALHMRHLRERFGLFVLIALGEATVMLVAIAANERWTPSEIAVGLTGAALIGAIGYLTLTTSGRPARRGSGLVMLAASHLFATAGIVTITSGACIALRDATVTVLPFYARILLATGLVLMGLAGFLREIGRAHV